MQPSPSQRKKRKLSPAAQAITIWFENLQEMADKMPDKEEVHTWT